jgi:replication-associated recombination protein RarA
MGIQEIRKDAVYFDCSNTTSRILDVLQEERPKIILVDEVDKLQKSYQNMLLNFMESSKVDVEQQKKQYHFEIKGAKIFATANDLSRLTKPFQSRFRKLFLPRYTEQQFIDVSVKVLKGKNLNDSLARYIGVTAFNQGGDIRDVLSIGKLVKKSDGPNDVDGIIQTLMKYGVDGD